MALVVLSLPLYFLKRKDFSGLTIFYLIFCFVFPIYYVISKDANLYGGWRHLLFIYAPFIVLSVFTLEFFLRKFQSKLLVQGLVLAIVIIGLVPAVKGIISYSPYQYTWFNTYSGGIKNNFNVYDTDYQQVCLKEGLDWLIENENILERETPLKIASNAPYAMEYYEELYDSAFTAVFTNYKGLKAQEWDYAIVNTLFVLPKVVDINYPPKGVVYRIEADGVPIGVVLKRENRYLLDGLNYMNSGRLQEGIQVLNKAFAYNSKDPYVWYLLGMAYHNTGDAKNSNNMLEAYAGIYGHDVSTMQAIGLNYLTLENYKQAQQYLNAVVSNGSKDPSVYYGLALAIYSQQGNKNQIASLCQQALQLNPNYRPAQILLNTVSK
jgi:tetratricopeptide (TPR) repeat protein